MSSSEDDSNVPDAATAQRLVKEFEGITNTDEIFAQFSLQVNYASINERIDKFTLKSWFGSYFIPNFYLYICYKKKLSRLLGHKVILIFTPSIFLDERVGSEQGVESVLQREGGEAEESRRGAKKWTKVGTRCVLTCDGLNWILGRLLQDGQKPVFFRRESKPATLESNSTFSIFEKYFPT